jgi:hypothetical protein
MEVAWGLKITARIHYIRARLSHWRSAVAFAILPFAVARLAGVSKVVFVNNIITKGSLETDQSLHRRPFVGIRPYFTIGTLYQAPR